MLTSSTQLQNGSFHVVERTRTSTKCQKIKNARAKRAKILFFIVKYANLWGFCCRRRRGCLSSLLSKTKKTGSSKKWLKDLGSKETWCCVGGRVKHENLLLSKELINVDLPPWKIWKADVSSLSPLSEWTAKTLTLETSAIQIFQGGNSNFINSFDQTKCPIWNHKC